MKEVVDNKTLWNEAARVGIVFGLFSSVCLGLKEAAALTNSTLVVTAAAIILWAVEFFGCILLMKKYMLDELEKHEGMTQLQLYKFGRRVALLSGFILAVVNAVLVSLIPDETLAETLNETMAAMPASMQADAEDTMALMMDKFPLLTFLGQWFYCFLYGSILSAIMSRYVSVYSVFKRNSDIDPNTPDDQSADDEPEEQ